MNAPFPSQIEAAARAWDVPALAAGILDRRHDRGRRAAGCEPDTLFRVASITKPLTATLARRPARSRGPDGDLARRRAGPPPPLPHERLRLRMRRSRAVRRRRRRARPGGAPSCPACGGSSGSSRSWSYANTRLLARRPPGGRARRHERSRTPLADAGAAPRRPRVDLVRRAGARRHRPRRDGGPYPRARRPSGGLVSNVPDLLRFGRWHLARPESARLRVAAREAGRRRLRPRPLRRARRRASRSGGTAARTAASSRRSSSCPTATPCSSG